MEFPSIIIIAEALQASHVGWIRKELSMHSGGESGIEKEKALLLRENLSSDPTESAPPIDGGAAGTRR